LLRRLRLRRETSAWASGGPIGGRRLAGEEQLGRFSVEQSKYYRLYLRIGKLTLAAMCLRRVQVAGRAACACGKNLGVAFGMVSRPLLAAPRRFLTEHASIHIHNINRRTGRFFCVQTTDMT